jgi:hypothetical protein
VFIFAENLLRKSMSVVGSEGWDVGEIMET